ncbi:NADP-dependent phosphogluconate dehydrogenase [Candidatus Peribacteria bacterium]|nr:NADP-dependent phosphogluconate dehydrogenase [Candidatus Peribacteria bacterium]
MQLGVIGLGTMGANLARNAASRGVAVSVYNRSAEKTDAFMERYAHEGSFSACASLKELCASLKPERVILLMVQAGPAVDAVLDELGEYLQEGDIVIDGGNSHYRDTERREQTLAKRGLRFIGMGVSGGEEGALKGPSMMPGGDEAATKKILPMLQLMAADDGMGGKCVSYIGPGGAGHFVKMVHNGIEYAVMQLIAEAYDLLRHSGRDNATIADAFAQWNASPRDTSFLLEITEKIFRTRDTLTGKDLIDVIDDAAGQKGTGKWTTEAAMHYGFAIPTINAAVDARILSGSRISREGWSKVPVEADQTAGVADTESIGDALSLSSLIAYMQGLTLIATASQAEGWNLRLEDIARIWRGGCIIRSALLSVLQDAYSDGKQAEKGMSEVHRRLSHGAQQSWRNVVASGVTAGVPLPAMTASLAFLDGMRSPRLPQSLIQAQRDFFGAHGFSRRDQSGVHHGPWAGAC